MYILYLFAVQSAILNWLCKCDMEKYKSLKRNLVNHSLVPVQRFGGAIKSGIEIVEFSKRL